MHPNESTKIMWDEKMRSPHDLAACVTTLMSTYPYQRSGLGCTGASAPAKQCAAGDGNRVE